MFVYMSILCYLPLVLYKTALHLFFQNPPTWQEILKNLEHELRNYLNQIHENKLKVSAFNLFTTNSMDKFYLLLSHLVMGIILVGYNKPQYVDDIAKGKAKDMIVGRVLERKDERNVKAEVCVDLELNQLLDRKVGELSGGELQRFAIAVTVMQDAQMYMFDEPSSYLDIKQRLKAAQVIRSLLRPNRLYIFLCFFVSN